jgi:hypothetical protein
MSLLTCGGCWNWIGHLVKFNYGQIQVDGQPRPSHRVSWMLHFGKIPDGMCVLHKCDNPSCVRPDHLFLGTTATNNTDRHLKNRDARGSRSGKSVLTEELVQQIRTLYKRGEFGSQRIANMLGLKKPTVKHVLRGRTWKWI